MTTATFIWARLAIKGTVVPSVKTSCVCWPEKLFSRSSFGDSIFGGGTPQRAPTRVRSRAYTQPRFSPAATAAELFEIAIVADHSTDHDMRRCLCSVEC